MASAASTYTWATYGTALKTYLGISGSTEDTNLQTWLGAACAACDNFVRRDADDWTTHGAGVWLGIMEYVRALRNFHRRGDVIGVTQRRTGALAENYGAGGMLTGAEMAMAAARDHWHHDALTIWLQGSKG